MKEGYVTCGMGELHHSEEIVTGAKCASACTRDLRMLYRKVSATWTIKPNDPSSPIAL